MILTEDKIRRLVKETLKSKLEEKGASKQDEEQDEGRMLKAQLFRVIKNAQDLHNMIGEHEEFPGWIQAKITKATDYLQSVRNHIEYEKAAPFQGSGNMPVQEE